jgi:hypothetical protein
MNKDFKAFPNHYINAIDENPDKNYFTPILNDHSERKHNLDFTPYHFSLIYCFCSS